MGVFVRFNAKAFHFGKKKEAKTICRCKQPLRSQKKKIIGGVFTPLGNSNSLEKFAFKQVATAELTHKNYTRLQHYYHGLPMKTITDSVPETFSLLISNNNYDPQHIYL